MLFTAAIELGLVVIKDCGIDRKVTVLISLRPLALCTLQKHTVKCKGQPLVVVKAKILALCFT
jgi:hypothetical protein